MQIPPQDHAEELTERKKKTSENFWQPKFGTGVMHFSMQLNFQRISSTVKEGGNHLKAAEREMVSEMGAGGIV